MQKHQPATIPAIFQANRHKGLPDASGKLGEWVCVIAYVVTGSPKPSLPPWKLILQPLFSPGANTPTLAVFFLYGISIILEGLLKHGLLGPTPEHLIQHPGSGPGNLPF